MVDEAPSDSRSWVDANRRYVVAAASVVRASLESYANRFATSEDDRLPDSGAEAAAALDAAGDAMPGLPAIERLAGLFGLSPFERALLLLGVGMEIFPEIGPLCAAAHDDERRPYPTFRLALEALPDSHWDALSPDRPLRRWHMVEIGAGPSLADSPLRLAERVLFELLGVEHVDERLAGLLEPVPTTGAIAPSHELIVEKIARIWKAVANAAYPAIQLTGGTSSDRRAVVGAACARLDRRVVSMNAGRLPTRPAELETLRRIWELEGAFSRSSLLLECDTAPERDRARHDAVSWMVEYTLGGVILSTPDRWTGHHRPLVTIEVGALSTREQGDLWNDVLAAHRPEEHDGETIQRLVTQFHLSAPAIRAAGLAAVAGREDEGADLADGLWEACRLQARPRIDDLAQRIVPSVDWDHLVLPASQRQLLHQLAVHVRQRRRVYETWGFDERGGRGLGVTALFAGSSGTGKTMAAEVLAAELRLDLYRVDLASVVSKYIGETEKNLRQIFDAAETGGVILLFDEADALFGKRSDVKDSHDRHANVEVSYLLQRMEAYRGLAILTTNIKGALDKAFLRRLRFIVNFPFPDVRQRREIWRRVFPPGAPTRDLDYGRLAQLNVTGGEIRNIALAAAFIAADTDEPISMRHLHQAVQSEYAKLDRRLAPTEVSGWSHGAAPDGRS